MRNSVIAIAISLSTALPVGAQEQQVVKSDNGSVFMEESPTPADKKQEQQKKTEAAKLQAPIDYSSLGVSVDQKGKIVPLLGGRSPVQQQGTQFQQYWGLPNGYLPGYNPYTNRNIAVPYTMFAPGLPAGSMPVPTKTEPWASSDGMLIDNGAPIQPRDNVAPVGN